MAYIDDIVIATKTIEDHLERIREVFECLREAGFKMRAEKSDFLRTETNYLGRVVSSEGIKTDPAAVSKNPRVDAPEKQGRTTKFPWICELLPRLHSFPCRQGTAYAGTVEEESTLLLERETPGSV